MGANRAFVAVLAVAFAIAAVSCSSSVTQAEAESIAADFVKERVKFFTRSENTTLEVPAYAFESVTTAVHDGDYVVNFNVSATLGNETKSADLEVTVSGRGQVVNLRKVST